MRPESVPAEVPRLGTLEARVMDVLWDHGPATVREVITQLATDPAYTTIATVLQNLGRKGMVRPEREGHSTRYVPLLTRHEHTVGQIDWLLETSRDRAGSILHFVDSMPESDRALLRDYLAGRGQEQDA